MLAPGPEQGLLWGRCILAGPGCKSPRESGVMKGAEIGELRLRRDLQGLGVFVCLVGSRGEGWCQGSPERHGLHLVPEHRLEDGHQEVSC